MGLFNRKPRTLTCPMCSSTVLQDERREHWRSHVEQIGPGQGDATGQYTWRCSCGPAGMKWEKDYAALAAIQLHMMQRHGIAM